MANPFPWPHPGDFSARSWAVKQWTLLGLLRDLRYWQASEIPGTGATAGRAIWVESDRQGRAFRLGLEIRDRWFSSRMRALHEALTRAGLDVQAEREGRVRVALTVRAG